MQSTHTLTFLFPGTLRADGTVAQEDTQGSPLLPFRLQCGDMLPVNLCFHTYLLILQKIGSEGRCAIRRAIRYRGAMREMIRYRGAMREMTFGSQEGHAVRVFVEDFGGRYCMLSRHTIRHWNIYRKYIHTRFPSAKWLGEWCKNETKSIQRGANTTTPATVE